MCFSFSPLVSGSSYVPIRWNILHCVQDRWFSSQKPSASHTVTSFSVKKWPNSSVSYPALIYRWIKYYSDKTCCSVGFIFFPSLKLLENWAVFPNSEHADRAKQCSTESLEIWSPDKKANLPIYCLKLKPLHQPRINMISPRINITVVNKNVEWTAK